MRTALALVAAVVGFGWGVMLSTDAAGDTAIGSRWTTVAIGSSAVWSVDKSKLFVVDVDGKRRRAAPVLRTHEGVPVEYIAIVSEAQCGNQRGDITLTTGAGEHVQTGVYIVAVSSPASAIAAALCEGVKR